VSDDPLRRRLREQQAAETRPDQRGPACRLIGAIMRGDWKTALQIAAAIDHALDWNGRTLNREPTDPGDGSGWR